MRDILFRGKRIDNGEWVEGAFCPKNCDGLYDPMVDSPSIIKLNEPNEGFWFDVDPDTVGQYTGLQDKNGEPFFEGDIVVLPELYGGGKGVITYCGAAFKAFSEVHAYRVSESMKVIGNIHDHPELLKGENHG